MRLNAGSHDHGQGRVFSEWQMRLTAKTTISNLLACKLVLENQKTRQVIYVLTNPLARLKEFK